MRNTNLQLNLFSSELSDEKTRRFIEKAKIKHGDRYIYSKVLFKKTSEKVIIICKKHGEFSQVAGNHLNGQNCLICFQENQRYTLEQFTEKARAVHGSKYEYLRMARGRGNAKCDIRCSVHGVFSQFISGHLKGHGCDKCADKYRIEGRRTTFEEFTEKAKLVHGNTYEYVKLVHGGNVTKCEMKCSEHGVFRQDLHNHLKGKGCAICKGGVKKTQTDFINKAIERHGDKYDYSRVEYVNASLKISIGCRVHGFWEQTPNNHLRGYGCQLCANKKHSDGAKKRLNGWIYSDWEKKAKVSNNFTGFKVYIIKCWNDTEMFYKIGKTFVDVKLRYKSKTVMPYNYETEQLYTGDAKYISELEKELQAKNKEFAYIPNIYFRGQNECFSEIAIKNLTNIIRS